MKFLIFFVIIVVSCSTSNINQKINNKKEGVWIDTFTNNKISYRIIGRFKNDNEVGTWRFYENNKLARKKKIKKKFCIKIFYHKNGVVESKGKTKTDIADKTLHWYYDGLWKYYNEKGKLLETRFYNSGTLISTQKY